MKSLKWMIFEEEKNLGSTGKFLEKFQIRRKYIETETLAKISKNIFACCFVSF